MRIKKEEKEQVACFLMCILGKSFRETNNFLNDFFGSGISNRGLQECKKKESNFPIIPIIKNEINNTKDQIQKTRFELDKLNFRLKKLQEFLIQITNY